MYKTTSMSKPKTACQPSDIDHIFEKEQKANGVYYFAKNGCPYCDRLAQELHNRSIPNTKYLLDPNDANYDCVASALKNKTGMKTFPMLYFGKNMVGGYSDFHTLCMTNGLHKKLKEIGIKVTEDF